MDSLRAIPNWVKVGGLYFAIVFAAGFAFGAVRELFLIPSFGSLMAHILEVPLMLAVSFAAVIFLVRQFSVARSWGERISMGLFAFGLLILAEIGVGLGLMGLDPGEMITGYRTIEKQLGLAAQILFAAMPALLLLKDR